MYVWIINICLISIAMIGGETSAPRAPDREQGRHMNFDYCNLYAVMKVVGK